MVKQGRTKLRKHRKTTGLQRRGRATQSAKPSNVLSGVSTRNTEGGDYGKFLHLKKSVPPVCTTRRHVGSGSALP
jgi:hypothetical protein